MKSRRNQIIFIINIIILIASLIFTTVYKIKLEDIAYRTYNMTYTGIYSCLAMPLLCFSAASVFTLLIAVFCIEKAHFPVKAFIILSILWFVLYYGVLLCGISGLAFITMKGYWVFAFSGVLLTLGIYKK